MNWKNNKGINMITLSIAVIILVVITSVLVYNAKDGTKIKTLNNLYNDIEQLNDKVSMYYLEHGDLPKSSEYSETSFIDNLDATQKNPNNAGKYYVINLSALDNVHLNYGNDFSSVNSAENVNDLKDLYIVNETSHTIYFVRGIEVQGKRYHTEPDEWDLVDLSDIPSIIITEFKIEGTPITTPPIPAGYYYVGGTIDTGYVISDNSADENRYELIEDVGTDLLGNQFVWVPVDQDQVISLKITSTEDITEIKLYDPFGDEINLGSVSGKTYQNTNIQPTVNGGYYLKVTTASETKTATLGVHSLFEIDTWSDYYGSDEYIDYAINNWYDGSTEDFLGDYGYSSVEEYKIKCGEWLKNYSEPADTIDYEDKVATNGGFYVGRYEATYSASGALSKVGTSTRTSSSTALTEGMLWNYISQTDALSTAKAYNASLNSSLLTGPAWDRTLGWLYETGNKTAIQIVIDSKDWGNYSDDTFSGTTELINTGTLSQTKANNIYDLAGNVREWTTEALNPSYRVGLGGGYYGGGSSYPASNRNIYYPSFSLSYLGFRLALYL